MPFKIVRNDITKMATEAIVNTANTYVAVGDGCDRAVYNAAGYDVLLKEREKIGVMSEGEVAITPGFNLSAKYIIHAVSPVYIDGNQGEEIKLRKCYKESLPLAKSHGIKSIAFPLISTGSFGYPKEEGMRIALDEINAFLMNNEMMIYLVVFGSKATMLGEKVYPDLEAYINHKYVCDKGEEEYGDRYFGSIRTSDKGYDEYRTAFRAMESRFAMPSSCERMVCDAIVSVNCDDEDAAVSMDFSDEDALEELQMKLDDRMEHMTDTFSEYLLYLIESKNMTNADVYNRAIVDKKVFSKIKNNPDYHPKKITALCLCIGAQLNMDEAKDLLVRAGYALSPCDKTDIIFSYFIENEIYDMIELDIQLEEHGLPSIIE